MEILRKTNEISYHLYAKIAMLSMAISETECYTFCFFRIFNGGIDMHLVNSITIKLIE